MKYIQERFKIEKNNFNLLSIILTIIVISLLSSVITGITIYFINHKNVILSANEKELLNTYNDIKNTYYKSVDANKVKDAAIDGMINYLNEDYSELLDNDESNSLLDKLNGKYKGIGISISVSKDKAIVISVQSGTPAEKADIRVNDLINKVNGVEINRSNINSINSLVSENDKVDIEIMRDNKTLKKTVNVKNIMKPSVSSTIFEENSKKVGYIYIDTFSNTTDKQFASNLQKLEEEKIDSLIIDVRDNTGGYLEVAKNIAEMFIIKGKPIYKLKSKDSLEMFNDTTKEKRNYDIVVLINKNTASASEILALALKESYGAIIVGTTSYGKGSVQQLGSLSNNENVKITIAKWYSPLGNSIDGVGITPGVYAKLGIDYFKNPSHKTDTQLQKSLEILTNK